MRETRRRRALWLAGGAMALAAVLVAGCNNGSSGTAQSTQRLAVTPKVTPNHAPEIQNALAAYDAALTAGDGDYLLAHLHAVALHFYGSDVCRAWFSRFGPDPTFAMQVHDITGPASWTFVAYGQTIATMPDVYTLNVTITQVGTTREGQAHFTWNVEKGAIRGFSPCVPRPG